MRSGVLMNRWQCKIFGVILNSGACVLKRNICCISV